MKNLLICLDRDGTLIYDKEYHLGSQKNWKSLVKILPTVTNGIKLLNKKLPKAKIFIVTNQPGVAVKQYPLLTEKKAEDICRYLIKKLKSKGALIHGFKVCGHASKDYQRKRKHKYTFYKKYTKNFECMKPNPGMIFSALKDTNLSKKDTKIYMIGDRATDIKAGYKAGGFGIYIPFKNTPNQEKELKKLRFKYKKSKNFIDAIKLIIKREKAK